MLRLFLICTVLLSGCFFDSNAKGGDAPSSNDKGLKNLAMHGHAGRGSEGDGRTVLLGDGGVDHDADVLDDAAMNLEADASYIEDAGDAAEPSEPSDTTDAGMGGTGGTIASNDDAGSAGMGGGGTGGMIGSDAGPATCSANADCTNTVKHATAVCAVKTGTCSYLLCDVGYIDHDHDVTNGCEASAASN